MLNNKKDKIKIILMIVAFITCLIGSIFSLAHPFKDKKNKSEEQLTQTEEKMNKVVDETMEEDNYFTEEEKEALSKEDKLHFAMGDFAQRYEEALKLGNDENKEFPKTESNTLYKNLLKKAETAEYNEILNQIEEKTKKYKFHEEYNWKIGNLYYDATLMMSTFSVEAEGKGEMVNNLKDPSMLLIGTLFIPETSRRVIIQDSQSLSPVFDGSVTINKHEEILQGEASKYKDNFIEENLSDFTYYKLHKFYFSIEQNPLIAYIMESESGKLEFFSIQKDGEYDCSYKTKSYWIQLDEKLDKSKLSEIE